MLKVLLLGAGTMGSVHARAYKSLGNVELIGIVDRQEAKAGKLSANTSAKVFTSYEEAVAKLNAIDVIDICLPTHLHKEYVMKSIGIARNIICEKPLGLNVTEAGDMIAACEKNNVRLFVGHVVRFFPEYKRIQSLLKKGSIGTPAVVRTTRGGAFPRAWKNWYGDFEKSGGLILDLLIHDFDFLRACFGNVERVYAKKLNREDAVGENIDYALVTIRFHSGVIAHAEGTWAHQGFSYGIEIAGTKGIIDYNSAKNAPLKHRSKGKKMDGAAVEVPESPLASSPYRDELKHFIDCIVNGKDPVVTAYDALHAIEIAMAALTSCETGQPVTLSTGELTRGNEI
ncbi:Gfo/Idh/MocA family oxidoreductase [Jeotgalibacillus sp. S-D1]|uniref:Gfo/Idh/MocA family protein n=1 Tax=Jeotgalibacillus sp. S-D1 TaxID=2552189 RepID=UPI0010593ED8|nr:Gfo/Idh/MocA family oxidoreductase [Jeotgalibacillus sp. S-D1]TDL32735.1 Gfo/Idh/MocA family oxidoreductase [Jeotgalibacillus sp. S-D1]